MSSISGAAQADLTNDAALVRLLLDDVRVWRQRLVETLSFRAHDTVRVESQYQVELTTGYLERHGLIPPGTTSVRAILPLTTRPKASLLGFDLTGPDGFPARLLRRRDIAAFEAEYLRELWEAGLTRLDPPNDALLEAIAGFHSGRLKLSLDEETGPDDGCSRFLSETLPFRVTPNWVAEWRERLVPVSQALCRALEEPPDPLSAAEFPVLALSAMAPRPQSVAEADSVLEEYLDKVLEADALEDTEFLEALADYGRRWEVLIETAVVLDQPVVLTLCEDRPMDIRRGRARVHLAMGDAGSYHLEARIEDHSVEFMGARFQSLSDAPIHINAIEDMRRLPHSLALYSSQEQRPFYARVEVRLRLSMDQRLASLLVFVLLLAAMCAAIFMPADSRTIEAMGLLTVPTTFAATLVLTRAESPLAVRLSITRRRALACTVLLLWLIAMYQVVDIDSGSAGSSDEAARGVQSLQERGGLDGEKRSQGKRASGGSQGALPNAQPRHRIVDEAR